MSILMKGYFIGIAKPFEITIILLFYFFTFLNEVPLSEVHRPNNSAT